MSEKGQMSQNNATKQSYSVEDKEAITFNKLIEYFSNKATLTENDIKLIKQYGEYRQLAKGAFLHKEGMIANYTFYIAEGLFRLFTKNENGEEFNLQFSAEDYWVNDYESYTSGQPSQNYIEALENSELIAFTKENLNLILQKSPTLHHLVEKLTEKNAMHIKERLMHQLKDSPQKRYESFITHYPKVYNRIPLYMIASYISVSRKTLTRIRGGK